MSTTASKYVSEAHGVSDFEEKGLFHSYSNPEIRHTLSDSIYFSHFDIFQQSPDCFTLPSQVIQYKEIISPLVYHLQIIILEYIFSSIRNISKYSDRHLIDV